MYALLNTGEKECFRLQLLRFHLTSHLMTDIADAISGRITACRSRTGLVSVPQWCSRAPRRMSFRSSTAPILCTLFPEVGGRCVRLSDFADRPETALLLIMWIIIFFLSRLVQPIVDSRSQCIVMISLQY